MRLRTMIVALLAATTLSAPVLAQTENLDRREQRMERAEARAASPDVSRPRPEFRAPDPRPEVRAPRAEGMGGNGGGWRGRQQTGDANVAPAPVFRGGGSFDGGMRNGGGGAGGGGGNWRGERRNGGAVAETPAAPPPVAVAPPVTRGTDVGRSGNWRGNGSNGGNAGGNWRGGSVATPPVVRSDAGDRRDGNWRNDERRNDGSIFGRDARRDGWNGNIRRDERRDGWNGNAGNRGNDGWRGQDYRRNDGRNDGWRNDSWRNDGARRGFNQRWDRNWRSDNRYNWQQNRQFNRNIYRLPRYYAPYGYNYGYRRFSIGVTLGSAFFGRNYWIEDVYDYRLPEVYPPYRWVRYYNDVLLVDTDSGEVVDVIYDFFW